MGLLTKLKSLLGLDDDRSQVRRTDSGVTIEREPEASPDAETESAVKGVDADAGESFDPTDEVETDEDAETGISTEDVTTAPAAESAESQTDDAAEPAEATQPSASAGQPAQTEGTEPEPTPEADVEADDGTEASEVDEDEADDESDADEEVTDEADADEQVAADDEADETVEAEDGADEEADEQAPVGEGEPLDDIKGIGSAYAERLNDAGVADVAELARADAEQLAAETGVSEKRIATWIDRAKAR